MFLSHGEEKGLIVKDPLIGEMFLDRLREQECDLDGRGNCVVSISSSTGGESD